MSDWRNYQLEVADFFRRAGWTVQVEAPIQGVRTRHAINVWALSKRLGIVVRWIVECKDWNSRVPKEKVLALRSIVDDIGADRGLILNEKGFQRGAKEAATSTNITVTTLAALEADAAEELAVIDLGALHKRSVALTIRMSKLWVTKSDGPAASTSRNRRGVVDQAGVIGNYGAASMIEDAVAHALVGHLPVPMPNPTTETHERAEDRDSVIAKASLALAFLEDWTLIQEQGVTSSNGWDDPWDRSEPR